MCALMPRGLKSSEQMWKVGGFNDSPSSSVMFSNSRIGLNVTWRDRNTGAKWEKYQVRMESEGICIRVMSHWNGCWNDGAKHFCPLTRQLIRGCSRLSYTIRLWYIAEVYHIHTYTLWTGISTPIMDLYRSWVEGVHYLVTGLTALSNGANMLRATTHRAAITSMVLRRLNTRLNAIGLLIARYLSILIAVIVKTEAATATPATDVYTTCIILCNICHAHVYACKLIYYMYT